MTADLTCFYCQNKAAPFQEGELPRGWVRLDTGEGLPRGVQGRGADEWGCVHVTGYWEGTASTLTVPVHAELVFCSRDHATKWLDVALDNLYHRTVEEVEG